MGNIRQKIAEIITHTHKTPLEQADEILLLFGVSGRSEQLCSCSSKILSNGDIQFSLCRKCQEEMNEHN